MEIKSGNAIGKHVCDPTRVLGTAALQSSAATCRQVPAGADHHEAKGEGVEGPLCGIIQAEDASPSLDQAQHGRKARLPGRERLEGLGLEDGVGAADAHVAGHACASTARRRQHVWEVHLLTRTTFKARGLESSLKDGAHALEIGAAYAYIAGNACAATQP